MYFSVLIVLLLACNTFRIEGSCPTCIKENCPPVDSSCTQSNKVLDECNCCPVCPKFVGETCGIGFGRCLYSLVCMRDDPYSDQGTCQDIDRDLLECNNAICIPDQPIECNEGEVYKPGTIRNCCATSGKCVCRRTTCQVPTCKGNELPVMTMPAALSGACCDSYICMPSHDASCPEDSVLDEQTQRCVCLHCDVIDCPDGFIRVRESLGNGEAGSCCDQDICVPVHNETCIHRGRIHFKDETWYPDSCHNCICLRGRTICIRNGCPPLPCQGSNQVINEGECCPHCEFDERTNTGINEVTTIPLLQPADMDYCVSSNGTRQDMGSIWDDGCQSCICLQEGITMCKEASCPEIKCRISIIKPGNCCPTCSDELTLDACELSNGELTYEGNVIHTIYHEDIQTPYPIEVCQSCQCTSNQLDCTLGPCDSRINTCSSLQRLDLHNLPSWLEDYAVVFMINNSLNQNPRTICSYFEHILTSASLTSAIQFYTHNYYLGEFTYFVITASERNGNYPYHTFKTPQDTMTILHSTPNPSLFQFQQILSYSEFQLQLDPSNTDTDGRFTTNMLILYSITGVFTFVLFAIIIVMTVVSTYTLTKMFQNHSFPCQKKKCNLSSLELNQNSLDRRVQHSSRYVEFQTKQSPSSGSNTTDSSCPV